MRILLGGLALALFWSASATAADQQSQSPSPPITEAVIPDWAKMPEETGERPMLSQGDPAWRDMRLGPRTVGEIGCLVFSILDILADMGYDITPTGWVRSLVTNGLIDSRGRLRWGLDRLFPIQTNRLNLRGEAAVNEARRQLDSGNRVTIQIRTPRGTSHWVVLEEIIGSTLRIRDPNGGRIGTLEDLYGAGARIITGLSVISRR